MAFGSKLVIRSGLQEAYFSSCDGDDDYGGDNDDDGLGLNYKVINMSTKIVGQNNISAQSTIWCACKSCEKMWAKYGIFNVQITF